MKDLLKVTNTEGETILIGTKNIIDVTTAKYWDGNFYSQIRINSNKQYYPVETNWVIETIEEIYNQL